MSETPLEIPRVWVEFDDPADSAQRFRCDLTWLTSSWTCIFAGGCQGIYADRPDDGCCTLGAHFTDRDDVRRVAVIAAELDEETWQHHPGSVRRRDWTEKEDEATKTKVVDGACIFLNRPGFSGGTGCALHLAADDAGESPIDWKPSVCWQLPVRVDWAMQPDGVEHATVRRWSRADWGDEGETMAWCCTEDDTTNDDGAYVGEQPVIESLAEELAGIAGRQVYVQLRARLSEARPPGT